MSRRITVLVGTDHHDFTRLVGWADAWQREHPDDEVLVQHGFSSPPTVAQGVDLVPPSDLGSLLTRSDVVVTHGGPGTIMSARHAGHHPLAVPRDPSRGEHVDGHQMHFVSWAAAKGLCDETVAVEDLRGVVARLGSAGTRTDNQLELAPEVDIDLLERTIASARHRRSSSPSAVRVHYFPGSSWQPSAVPPGTPHSQLLVLGNVSRLWLGGPDVTCSCGLHHQECALWGTVGQRALDGPEATARLRALHADLRAHPAAAARRHPGAEGRRRYVDVALTYQRVCTAALEVTGADVVVDHGGPLVDVLPLSHSRELDLRVLRPATTTTADKLVLTALRWRGVPTWRTSGSTAPTGPSVDLVGAMSEHQLLPPSRNPLHRSIT